MEPPISASQGAMRSLPRKLESLVSGPKHELRASEKKKLRGLQAVLQQIIDKYLIEPSEVVSPASTANSWMKDVRDLSYDIDDFIYELAHVVGGGARISVVQKPPRFKIRRFPEKLRRRRWVTDEISRFRTRVKEAIRLHEQCLGNCKWRPSSSGQPPPPPSGCLVGVESSIQQLCGWLANEGHPGHRVVSIVGTGGVGKTTLATEVYRRIGGQFQCLAFVRTSPKADMKGLLTSVLSQVRRHRHVPDDALDVHKLVVSINEHLQNKTYLIVIEDLWALSTWDLVNRALPKGNCCSRILMTTEADVIAQACCAYNLKFIPAKKEDNTKYMPSEKEDKPMYMPSGGKNTPMYMPSRKKNHSKYIIMKEPLCEDDSRELFLNRAFGKQAQCPQGLKEVSNEIVKRSGGLPLGISILASLLAHHPASSIEQWNYIKNSLSSDLTTQASWEKINQVLKIGYDNLPHDLKACMLYLCMYEEDCIIWKDDLVTQWIAEGFISAVKEDDKEEVAHDYFGELVNRGMIQPVDSNCSAEIQSCRVHHMVLNFIRDKSMEENFSIAIDHSHTTIRLADKVRRLALHLSNLEDATPPGPESMRLSKVRSIAFSGFHKYVPSILEFRFIQVLNIKLLVDPGRMMSHNLTGCDVLSGNITEPDCLSYNLTEISELFRLRYFHLDACHMNVALPTRMQQLKDLVAWHINAEVTSVPSDIVNLPGLLYLRIPSEAHLPSGIGRVTSLRTLGVFDLSKNSTEDVMRLGELTNLQDLRLTCSTLQTDNLEKNLECLGSIIRKLTNLKCVTLVPAVSSPVHDAGASSMSTTWHGFAIASLPPALLQRLELSWRCCHFSTLPEWTKELTKLCILKIAVRKVSKEDVVTLKCLPSLTALSLFSSTSPAIRIIFDNEGFSVLKYFKFVCAAPCLEFLEGAMPNVRKLKIGFNANRMNRYSLDGAGFKRLTGLNEISIKIGSTGSDEGDRKSAEVLLTDAIVMHPCTPIIINLQWVDWDICGDDEKHIEPRKEIHDETSEKKNVTAVESLDEHGSQEKNLEEDGKNQADKRTYSPPESAFIRMQNTDLKLPSVEKHTDGVAEKHKVDSDGYGEIEKKVQANSYYMNTPKHISLSILKEITNGFSPDSKIGQGRFADVHKGVYDGREIAVKLLHVDVVQGLNDLQFKNEVRNLWNAKHQNIVQFIGYCYETSKIIVDHNGADNFSERIYRAICFDYLKDGSLKERLYDQSFAPDWSIRYNIIKGICEGLNFLHKCVPPIFHLDLKPANILLDSFMEPKVADFGLSRMFTQSHTHVTEEIVGTRKYMPPEYKNEGKISSKNDVFSLGLVMIEIMTAPAGHSNSVEVDNVAQLMQQVLTKWGTAIEDRSKYRTEEIHQVKTCIELAICCVDSQSENRPPVAAILEKLNKTEAHMPRRVERQLADELPFPTGGPRNTDDTWKTLIDELEHPHCNSIPRDSFNNNVQQATDSRETTSYVNQQALIIGRTEEKQKIMDTLSGSSTSNFTVLPIYGIGGIGKTTLAQFIFNHSQFADHLRAWVYVSQNLDLNKIGNSIISQLSGKLDSPVTEMQIIHMRLSTLLAGTKILIVLDDVWEKNPDKVETLIKMLRLGSGSTVKIIVTTRDKAVAEEICPNVEPYKLEPLSDEICWEIIKQKSAFELRDDKIWLNHIGKDIAIKCGGVALAAQSLGYMLKRKSYNYWKSVSDSYIWNLSTSHGSSSGNHEVLASLLLSYTHMPDWLKLCFSYCAVFPKGHLIEKYGLFHQWIALGFTEQSSMFDPMQLCEEYVTQLLEMSFLQHSETQPSNQVWHDKDVTFFTMHDLVHDLARDRLAHQIYDGDNGGGDRCRYAFLEYPSKPSQLSVTSQSNLKALHFQGCGTLVPGGGVFSQATCLCVLHFYECNIHRLPDTIGKLKNLRYLHATYIIDQKIPDCITGLSKLNYLNLGGSPRISALPESIGDMECLIHLDLSGCIGINELPESFAKLKQLVHLNLSYCSCSITESFGGFTKLQYLNLSLPFGIDADRTGLAKVIGKLIKLRYLNLSGCMRVMLSPTDEIDSLLCAISTLFNLEHLDLSMNKEIHIIPESMGNLIMLRSLDLSECIFLNKLPDSMINMVSLKVLNVEGCVPIDESVLSLLNIVRLPCFPVHASSDKCSSNIIRLKTTNPSELKIERLENVTSAEEAHGIELIEKQKLEDLAFEWTIGAERFVHDKEVLEKLVPPRSVHILHITGYINGSLPDWLTSISQYLPILKKIYLSDFPNCNNLPPLAQLPNLEWLTLCRMKALEEWNTEDSSGVEVVKELPFPKLERLYIKDCAKLRTIKCPCGYSLLEEVDCDVLLSSVEERSSIPNLIVEDSKVPSLQCRFLAFRYLTISGPGHLTISSGGISHLSSLESLNLADSYLQAELPRWVAELTSLQELILNQVHTGALPQWLQELASLKKLEIYECLTSEPLRDCIQDLDERENVHKTGKVNLAHLKLKLVRNATFCTKSGRSITTPKNRLLQLKFITLRRLRDSTKDYQVCRI